MIWAIFKSELSTCRTSVVVINKRWLSGIFSLVSSFILIYSNMHFLDINREEKASLQQYRNLPEDLIDSESNQWMHLHVARKCLLLLRYDHNAHQPECSNHAYRLWTI